MRADRRRFLALGAALTAARFIARTHAPAVFRERPITLVVPTSPGGVLDTLARTVGKRVGDELGQAVVIENRPGASTMVATNLSPGPRRMATRCSSRSRTWPSIPCCTPM